MLQGGDRLVELRENYRFLKEKEGFNALLKQCFNAVLMNSVREAGWQNVFSSSQDLSSSRSTLSGFVRFSNRPGLREVDASFFRADLHRGEANEEPGDVVEDRDRQGDPGVDDIHRVDTRSVHDSQEPLDRREDHADGLEEHQDAVHEVHLLPALDNDDAEAAAARLPLTEHEPGEPRAEECRDDALDQAHNRHSGHQDAQDEVHDSGENTDPHLGNEPLRQGLSLVEPTERRHAGLALSFELAERASPFLDDRPTDDRGLAITHG